MTILLTGGAGFIGSNLIRHILATTNHSVVNVDKLTYAGNLASLADVSGHPRYTFFQADISDAAEMNSAFAKYKPGAVMHLAAESHVDRSIDDPSQFIETNIVGTFNLLHAAREWWQSLSVPSRQGFRFINISTDEVFGSLDPTAPPFNENTPYDPHSPYSASKAASDHLVRAWYHTYGLPVIITNCSNNYGPFQFPEKLIPVVILKALQRATIPIYGAGDNIRDWLYVGDHCEALTTVLDRGRVGETYCIGGMNERRNIDIVYELCRLVDEESKILGLPNSNCPSSSLITSVPDRPGHDKRYAVSSQKIQLELGWRPKENQESGLRKTVRWYLENQEWWTNILDGSYQMQRLGTKF
jgi:dTDP-glucose 4,6-dehydratase